MTGDNAFFAFTSKRAGDRKWKVTAFNDDNTNSHELKVFAYCDKRQPGLVERSKSTTVAGGAKTSLAPKCPNGRQAVSGGFESATVNTPFDAAFTFASRRISQSTWKTSAYGNGDSATEFTDNGLRLLQHVAAAQRVSRTPEGRGLTPRRRQNREGGPAPRLKRMSSRRSS